MGLGLEQSTIKMVQEKIITLSRSDFGKRKVKSESSFHSQFYVYSMNTKEKESGPFWFLDKEIYEQFILLKINEIIFQIGRI